MKCQHCEKEFSDKEALGQHMSAKHGIKKSTFRIKPSLIGYTLAAIILIGIGYAIYSSAASPGKYDELATCMKEKGAKFYGAFWCENCERQKQMFGKSASLLPYIECSAPDQKSQTQICIDNGITGYPTWIFADNSRLVGVQTMDTLKEKTGCQ